MISVILPVIAYANNEHETVRIGYYENEVFQEGADDGAVKTGYAYEYYQKLSEYTGWKYTYIYDGFNELYQMLLDGEIDLLAGLAWREEREALIGYPDAAMGNESYYLVKHEEDNNITAELSSLNGSSIGVLDSAMVSVLNQYLDDHDITAAIVTYPDYTQLFNAFDSHTVDILAAESDGAYGREHAEVISSFGASDYYLCVNKNRPDLLTELNTAQTLLATSEPNYLSTLKARYYSASLSAHAFSQGEREWLDSHTSLRVGYLNNYLPYCDTDKQGNVNGAVRDIVPAILDAISRPDIGVTYIGYKSYDDMIAAINAGEIDVAFPVGGGLYYSEENGIYQSNTVSASPAELVYKGEFTEKTTEQFVVNENNRMQYYFVRTNYPDAEITFCGSSEECLSAVLSEKAGCATMNGLRANDILRNRKYNALSHRQTSYIDSRCFGVEIGNEGLLRLINRGIGILGVEYTQNLLHLYNDELFNYGFIDLLRDHMVLVVALILAIAAVIISLQKWEKKAEQERDEAKTIALTDPLTGVKSKHAFLMKQQQIDASIKEGRADAFAIVACDVNGLKVINDTLGHKAGDEYIRSAGRMICDIFQHSPVYRTGGDEFVVILCERDYFIRKELVLALHDRSVEHISTREVVISGGLSDYQAGVDTSFHDVFERADELMYEEKKLLKGMGAISREDAEAAVKPIFPEDEDAEILNLKRHVLIVEDEQINQMILGNMLKDVYDVLYASDGNEALEQVKTHKDDLAIVLLDLQMPKMSGMEVLRVMKEEEEFRSIPVIVMTVDQSAEVSCLKIGAIDFIPKPYPSPEIILARVNRCIELSEKRNIIQSTERDSLTNLFNLDYFLRYVRMYDQHYHEKPMDAVVLDVNHFHLLNERYGKQYGDGVLSRIGMRIRQISREIGGVCCRRGADTFFIYCPHREDYESILDKASEGLVDEDVSANRVRLRMGVYSQVDKSLQIEHRFDYAKIAANSVKNGYRKAVGVYDTQMHEAELYRERLLEDFKPSLESKRFIVYFQPKYDIRPDKPVLASAEALVRWNHPELGMINPEVFIPLLEDNGLILDLDRFVWSETAARIQDWKNRCGFSVPVSVNVSRIDMLTPDLKNIFTEILAAYGLSPDDLMLEITESAYTGDSDQVNSTAKDLRGMGMGFRIEMDDFGTGYSSLGMLTHLPIDALKLDMSFIRSAFGETKDVRMIELIIDIADYMHVPVVAEGVETEEQYMVLKAMGCEYVQGYYFSKPVPPEDFDRFIIERAEMEVEVTPAVRKTCMSISKALSGDFESIFYVDVVTAFYLEFFMGKDGDLEIRPAGTDFFEDAREKLLENVSDDDVQKVKEAISKANLIHLAEQEEDFILTFCKEKNGVAVPYSMQKIKTRESDHQHVVIGVRREVSQPDEDNSRGRSHYICG